jgi:hypothetical protein
MAAAYEAAGRNDYAAALRRLSLNKTFSDRRSLQQGPEAFAQARVCVGADAARYRSEAKPGRTVR